MPKISRPLTLLLLLALAVSATQPPTILAGPEPGWLSSQAAAQAGPGPIVRQAFDLLMDRFVVPPQSSVVLSGGWQGGLTALREKGVENLTDDAPSFSDDRSADWRLFAQRYDHLADAAEDKLPQLELDRAIVAGMARALDEGHTYYLTPEHFREAQAAIRNDVRYAGVGARFNRELVVLEVFADSPAEQAGLKPGDQLVAVDGNSVEGQTPFEASSKVRGEAGTPVALTVRREGSPEPITLNIVRREIRVDWLAYRVLDGNIGYLQIRNFPLPDALPPFHAAMAAFDEAKITALVIDVRGNGGGSVDTGIQILSRFVPQRQPLFQRVDRLGGQRTVTAWGDYWGRDIPIAVIADGSSGSMSEILASALQENEIGRVFGTKTSGNVAGTNYHPLADGSALAVTSLLINSGQGKVLNDVGLEPDETVELDAGALRLGRDTQFDAAVGWAQQEALARANRAARIEIPAEHLLRPVALPLAA